MIFTPAEVATSHRGIGIIAIDLRTYSVCNYIFSAKYSGWAGLSPGIARSEGEGRAVTVPTGVASPCSRFHTAIERWYSQQRDVSWILSNIF